MVRAIAVGSLFLLFSAPYCIATILTLAGRDSYWGTYDYRAFYAAATLVGEGRSAEMYDVSAIRGVISVAPAYFNPPFFALALVPLSRLSLERGFQAWSLLSLMLLCCNASLIWKMVRPAGRGAAWCAVVGLFTCGPVLHALILGQFSFVLLTSWTCAMLFLRRGADRAAGAALVLLALKPELLLIAVAALARPRPRTLHTLVPLTACLVLVSVAVLGVRSSIAYPLHLLRTAGGQDTVQMYGWSGIVGTFALPTHVAAALSALLAVGTVAVAAVAGRSRLREGGEAFSMAWLVLTTCLLLADMHLFLQDVMLLAPAMALAYRTCAGRRSWAVGVGGVCAWILLWAPAFPPATFALLPLLCVAVAMAVATTPAREQSARAALPMAA